MTEQHNYNEYECSDEETINKQEYEYTTKTIIDSITGINIERLRLEDEVRELRKRVMRLEQHSSMEDI